MTDGHSADRRPARVSTDAERRADLNKRLRAAFIEGAERDSLRRLGLTAEEIERVLRRYPGDV